METSGIGQLAVVTGASSGIGYELARELISRGYDVLVTAENDRIMAAATRLGPKAIPFTSDLATFIGVEKLCAKIRSMDRPPAIVAINAGVGVGGEFATETHLEDELNIINLNATSSVHLAKRMAADMVGRGEGRILLTSSIASTMSGPFYAVYAASMPMRKTRSSPLASRTNCKPPQQSSCPSRRAPSCIASRSSPTAASSSRAVRHCHMALAHVLVEGQRAHSQRAMATAQACRSPARPL